MRLSSWLGGSGTGPSRRAKLARSRRTAGRPLSVEHLEGRDVPAFAAPVAYDAGAAPQAVVAGYFDGDDVLDLAVANSSDNTVSVLLGNGDGTFQDAVNYSTVDPVLGTGSGPHSLAVGDLNGDDILDVVTANASDVSVLLGTGGGTLGTASGYTVPNNPTSVAAGDFTGDGLVDLGVMSSYYGYAAYANVLVGDGAGTFSGLNPTYLGDGYYRSALAVNLDGVGADELVAANTFYGYYYGAVAVLAADEFDFLQPTHVLYTGYDAVSVAVGDVNDDGTFDIVTADFYSYYYSYSLDRVSVLLGNGGGGFGDPQSYAVGSYPIAVALGDFTGDGNVDIATANHYSADVSVLYGSGGGAFAASTSFAAGSYPYALAAGDFDNDDRPDAAAVNAGTGDLAVLMNDGDWPDPPPPTVTVGDVWVVEGNGGTGSPTTATFTVYLSAVSLDDVTVHYATADGSATAGDYTPTSGDVTIPAGYSSWTFTVPVTGDRLGEDTEYFAVNLSAPVNATVGDGQGFGFIYDDEPRVYVNDVTVTEGNTGSLNATFTVTLSEASDVDVTVHYATATDTASAGDFTAAAGDLTIPHGQLSRTFTVAVTGDRLAEATEYFLVNLSAPVNAGVGGHGVGIILDNEPRLSINNVSKKEGNGGNAQFVFTVRLSAAYDQAVTVNYATSSVNGTATANSDYQSKNGTLTFAAGVTSMTITVTILPDKVKEGDETFFVNLSGASSNAFLAVDQGVGTILDDDIPPGKKK